MDGAEEWFLEELAAGGSRGNEKVLWNRSRTYHYIYSLILGENVFILELTEATANGCTVLKWKNKAVVDVGFS